MKNKALTTPRAKEILMERKRLIAKEKQDYIVQKTSSIFVFTVDKTQKYAIPYEQIERVIPLQAVTHVPGAHPIFLGVLYHNMEIWPVISSSRLLGLQEETISFYILCEHKKLRLALSAYEIVGQKDFQESETSLYVANEKNRGEAVFIKGIYETDIAIIALETIFDRLTQTWTE